MEKPPTISPLNKGAILQHEMAFLVDLDPVIVRPPPLDGYVLLTFYHGPGRYKEHWKVWPKLFVNDNGKAPAIEQVSQFAGDLLARRMAWSWPLAFKVSNLNLKQ